MKKRLLAMLSVGLLSAGLAFAGATKLVKTTPENGSVSDSPPPGIVLEFTDRVTLTKAYIRKDGEKEKSIQIGPQKDAKTVTIAVPELHSGHYVVEWTVFTHESIALTGRIGFTVAGAGG